MTQTQPELLKKAVRRVSEDWLSVYAKNEAPEHLIKSLLIGIEQNIRWRTGEISGDDYRRRPEGVDANAYYNGLQCAEKISDSILRRVCKF